MEATGKPRKLAGKASGAYVVETGRATNLNDAEFMQ